MVDTTLPKGKNLVHFILLPPKGTDGRQVAEILHVACVTVINLVLHVACLAIISLVNVACVTIITLVLFRLFPIEVIGGKYHSYCLIITHKV